MESQKNLTLFAAWKELQKHQQRDLNLKQLFVDDQERFEKYSISLGSLLFDYSKNLLDDEIKELLICLAMESGLKKWIYKQFHGEKINNTEERAVLHTALRAPDSRQVCVDGIDVTPVVMISQEKMYRFVDRVHSGEWKGYTGKQITHIVNIGIGGSHLGPEMVTKGLAPYQKEEITTLFIANLDADYLVKQLQNLPHEQTLFIIASKSFSTQETLENAKVVREWFLTQSKDESAIASHFIAVSNNIVAATEFGIKKQNIFEMWDWVGGRFSLWSTVGISIALSIGVSNFKKMLAGAQKADYHFSTAEFEHNIPVIMALLGIWYRDFHDVDSYAIVPYIENLNLLVNYLQQADMESNGKSIARNGTAVDYKTAPVIWGGTGANSQHAFFQHLHQGTGYTPVDFIAAVDANLPVADHQDLLLANCLAQSCALMNGKTEVEVREEMQAKGVAPEKIEQLLPFRIFEGNRPSSTFMFDKMTPESLGLLIALYEHKIFVQGVIWQLNSYDQWGVELGKKLADDIAPDIQNPKEKLEHDGSTNGLIRHILKCREL
ncbi:MAG: glucose-6-phosphate isomerase [Gammaproteobacteria bacterium]|nr:MAG: glucose-6-phosphate isomerase [Gammaproteobacteria bacterium]